MKKTDKLLLSLGILVVVSLSFANAVCYTLSVSGSFNDDNNLHGNYEHQECRCSGKDTWLQKGDSDKNSIEWSNEFGWIVGSNGFCDPDKIRAKQDPGEYDYPYDVPEGSWFELDEDGEYANSPSMEVDCEEDDNDDEENTASRTEGAAITVILMFAVVRLSLMLALGD